MADGSSGLAASFTAIVGAGISVPPPTRAPDFRSLRNRFLRLADDALDPKRFELEELSPEQVFEALDDGREELRRAIRRELWWLCEPREPNPNHYAVAALLNAGMRVWTPNFDTMIERAAARLDLSVSVAVPGESLAHRARSCLFKPHGSFPYGGDEPHEPPAHDYPLLFSAAAVWQLEEDWSRRLLEDLDGQDVVIFGYRGADPDLTPIILRGLQSARSVAWWELAGDNVPRLRRLLAGVPRSSVMVGDPSIALRDFALKLAPYSVPTPRGTALTRPPDDRGIQLSEMSKAQLLGQFRGSVVARRHLRAAVLRDPPENRRSALFKLLRSIGFDVGWARPLILSGLSVALRLPRLRRRLRLQELFATLIDARTVRPGDRRAIRRLLSSSAADTAPVLVRVASIEKLHGELRSAVRHGGEALRDLERRSAPRLEAMAVYNLAWTYRQQADFVRRSALLGSYQDRLPHIGFNWAAWLGLDDVLVALHLGDVARARSLVDGPTLEYARSLIGHPMYQLDDALNETLVRWHESGPVGIDERLRRLLRDCPLGRFGHPPFTAVDTLIVLADHARAVGNEEAMRRRLRRARRRTSSDLQLAEIELVAAVSSADERRLEELRARTADRGFGLVSATADAAHAHLTGRRNGSGIYYRPDLPLAGVY